jgi:hypothetical protein
VKEDAGLGAAGGPKIVMHGDRVEELRTNLGFERSGSFLDQAEAEMDVPEQPTFV